MAKRKTYTNRKPNPRTHKEYDFARNLEQAKSQISGIKDCGPIIYKLPKTKIVDDGYGKIRYKIYVRKNSVC